MKFFKSNIVKFNNEYSNLDLCVVQDDEGDVIFYKNNKIHNIKKAALYLYCKNTLDEKLWFVEGNLHRTDGPAIERKNGFKIWYLNDRCYGKGNDYNNVSWQKFVKLIVFN